jgi:hypothetical protein
LQTEQKNELKAGRQLLGETFLIIESMWSNQNY